MQDEYAQPILKELAMLRKLRMMEFIDKGYSQTQPGQILDVSQPTISRMLSKVIGTRRDIQGE